tara:strand:+ start:8538 stop:8951 length:414 start_codon:yes stop_codon:yes gene_type:complete
MAISHIPRSVGHNFVPEYQISAIPYMRSLTVGNTLFDEANDIRSFSFPKITQWLSFKTLAGVSVTVYFCKEDAVDKKNGLIVAAETTLPLYLRCAKLYFNNTGAEDNGKAIQVRAGLTSINSSEFNNVVEKFLEANN